MHGKSAVPASRIALLTGLLLLLLGASLTGAAQKETRVALVIGNSAYRHTPPLPNPRNDASDIAGALKRLGFDTLLEVDLDKRGMDEAFRRFARLARDTDAALFFYAGHAMSFAGVNYLMPTDARLQDEADLPYEMAKVDDVISDLARARNVRILILDACRDNPLVERLRMNLPATRSAAVARGLERIERPQGMIAAFATQPGQVAGDGVGTRNSPFTSALLKHIATPGVESGTLFRRVAGDVYRATSGKQLPELQISLLGEFYFAGSQELAAPGVGSQTIATAPATAPTETPSAPLQAAQPTLLGKYGDWGAYSASPDGKKVCFAIAKPLASKPASAEVKRDSPHIFVSSRPADNVRNEVSVSIGYPFQASSLATAEIGDTKFTMWTKNDGAWIKDSADEQRLVDAMRKGTELVLKGVSTQGLQSIDRYSLKGLAQALDRIEQECR